MSEQKGRWDLVYPFNTTQKGPTKVQLIAAWARESRRWHLTSSMLAREAGVNVWVVNRMSSDDCEMSANMIRLVGTALNRLCVKRARQYLLRFDPLFREQLAEREAVLEQQTRELVRECLSDDEIPWGPA